MSCRGEIVHSFGAFFAPPTLKYATLQSVINLLVTQIKYEAQCLDFSFQVFLEISFYFCLPQHNIPTQNYLGSRIFLASDKKSQKCNIDGVVLLRSLHPFFIELLCKHLCKTKMFSGSYSPCQSGYDTSD